MCRINQTVSCCRICNKPFEAMNSKDPSPDANPKKVLLKQSSSECDFRFQIRESALTLLGQTTGGQVLYSIILSATAVMLMIEGTRYYFDRDLLHADLLFLYRLFGTVGVFILVGACVHVPIFLILYPTARLHGLHGTKYMFPATAVAVIFMIAATPITLVSMLQTSHMVRWMIGVEHVRIMLKVVAYSTEIHRCGGATGDRKLVDKEMFTLKSLAYYLVAPVLLFCPSSSYPGLERPRRLRIMLGHLLDVVMLSSWGFLVYRRFYEPVIWELGTIPFSKLSVDYVIRLVWSSILLGWCNLMGIGVGFLHSWLNLWSEILDFGDRQFYKSWWLVNGINEFMRTWNFLIHSWINEYFYKPIRSMTGSKQVSQLAVILASAVIHDYIMSLCFGFLTSVFSAIVICVVIPTFVFAAPASYLQERMACNFFTFFVLHMTAAVMGFMGGADVATRTTNCFQRDKSLFNPLPGFFDCEL